MSLAILPAVDEASSGQPVSKTTHLGASPMFARLSNIFDLSPEDKAAVESLAVTVREFPADFDVVADGTHPTHCCIVMEGFTCRYKVISDGRRQILAFNIPGDVPDLQSLHLDVMDHTLATVVPSRLGFVSHIDMRALCEARPGVAAAFWRETLIDGAAFRAWMTGIGRLSARARLAHLLCELMLRLDAVGLADGFRYRLPLTQAELGDALGLSVVHVNRLLQELKAEGHIQIEKKTVTIQDWDTFRAIAQFDPDYLHLKPRATKLT
jgi:CRP-like cAMP-binding protein